MICDLLRMLALCAMVALPASSAPMINRNSGKSPQQDLDTDFDEGSPRHISEQGRHAEIARSVIRHLENENVNKKKRGDLVSPADRSSDRTNIEDAVDEGTAGHMVEFPARDSRQGKAAFYQRPTGSREASQQLTPTAVKQKTFSGRTSNTARTQDALGVDKDLPRLAHGEQQGHLYRRAERGIDSELLKQQIGGSRRWEFEDERDGEWEDGFRTRSRRATPRRRRRRRRNSLRFQRQNPIIPDTGKSYPRSVIRAPNGQLDPWDIRPAIHLVPNGPRHESGSLANGTLQLTWTPVYEVHIHIMHDNRVIKVGATGLYFVYAQVHYNWQNTGQGMGHCINVGDRPWNMTSFMCSRTAADLYGGSTPPSFRNVNTNYVGGALYLRAGALLSVTMLREEGQGARRSNTILANNDFTFFGAFMLT